MKKLVLGVALLTTLSSLSLVSCGKSTEKNIDDLAKAASKMTEEELIAKAKEESGAFLAYGNTSRITKAVENFKEKYGSQINLTEATGTKLSDTEIYTSLTNEYSVADNSKGASFVLVQDSASLASYRENSNILTNYYPESLVGKLDENELVPLTHQYINKLFMWNNTAGEDAPKFSNVWELTEAKYKNKIYFKSPKSEQVNMNFLTMLTSDEWVGKLTTAYKSYFGTDYVADSKYESIAYKWIVEFLANADTSSYTSDTKMASGLSQTTNSDKVGLFVLSKLRDSSVLSDNLTVGAWEENSITPFAGFMYAIYAQVATNAPRPYTAMLFTNYLMTAEGFNPWGGSIGGYSSNVDIPVYEGDKEVSFYKQCLVFENGSYINSVKVKVEDFINKQLG